MTKRTNKDMKRKKKLTQYQKNGIMLIYVAMRYSESLHQRTQKETEKQFVKDIEELILN